MNGRPVVIGGGIVGAAITYRLAEKGANPILVERSSLASGATSKSFGWLTAAEPETASYAKLRREALQAYRRLHSSFEGSLPIRFEGALYWGKTPQETERRAQQWKEPNDPRRLIDANEIRALEPNFANPPELACFDPTEGSTHPLALTRKLVEAAIELGATLIEGFDVSRIQVSDNCTYEVYARDQLPLAASNLILANGMGAVALCAPLGIELPVVSSPALLMIFDSQKQFANHIISGPEAEFRQAPDSSIWVADHSTDPMSQDEILDRAQLTKQTIESNWSKTGNLRFQLGLVGNRPMPKDGLPILGPAKEHPNLYLAVSHSAVTLAPLIGELVTQQVVEGEEPPLLHDFRPR